MIATLISRLPPPSSEDGVLLLEVIISALLVALIAVATFSGIDSTNRTTFDERAHNQATVIAQQDEERLHGLTAAQLGQMGSSSHTLAENGLCVEKSGSSWRYINSTKAQLEAKEAEEPATPCKATEYAKYSGYSGVAYTGNVYTVSSSAEYVTASESTTGAALACESSSGSADYIQTTSSVTWPTLGSRPPVSQSSILSAPIGRALLVKVINQNKEPVAGATVTATGLPSRITPASGCVIFGAIAASEVTVLATKTGWVEVNGKTPSSDVVKLSSGATTSKTYQIGEPGAIAAEFSSVGSPSPGETFVALQTGMTAAPSRDLEGTVSTSAALASANYLTTVSSSKTLFPFVKPGTPAEANPYTAYAGDCVANDPASQSKYVEEYKTETGEAYSDPTAQVNPGSTVAPSKKLVVPPVKIVVYTGTAAGSGNEGVVLTSGTASLTNTKCLSEQAPVNNPSPTYVHYQPLNPQGHLTYQNQPFGEWELCVSGMISGSSKKATFKFTNNTGAGPSTEPSTSGTTKEGYGVIYLGAGKSGTC